jgi:Icc-related predicted phosphoesterase
MGVGGCLVFLYHNSHWDLIPCSQVRREILFCQMMNAVAVTDLHGNSQLYELLLRIVDLWKISSVFISGDLAPGIYEPTDTSIVGIEEAIDHQRAFFADVFIPLFEVFLSSHRQTHVYVIMGNDDRRVNESMLQDFDRATRNFHLVNDRLVELRNAKQIRTFFPDEVPRLFVAGYPYVPIGGGLLMDWVKHENRVGLMPPGMESLMDIDASGIRTVEPRFDSTIEEDLADFSAYLSKWELMPTVAYDPASTIHLFHAPPYDTPLDQIAPQGRYDFVNLPDHIGSTEIRRFIERAQPYFVLCGHCHEAVVLGNYKTDIGATRCVNAGSQTHINVLSIVQFDPYNPTEMKQFFINAQ